MSTTEEQEHRQYVSNLELLVRARTDQLRTSVKESELLRLALDAITKADTLDGAKRTAGDALTQAYPRALQQSRES
jgi:hypothetical protein